MLNEYTVAMRDSPWVQARKRLGTGRLVGDHIGQHLGVRLSLLMGLFMTANAMSEQLTAIGPTYPIAEPHLLEQIRDRLIALEQSGELSRRQSQAQAHAVNTALHPQANAELHAATVARNYAFDPSFTLDRNIADAQGQLMFAAGTRLNPLEWVTMSQHLLFLDATQANQVKLARQLIDFYRGQVKPILVAGRPAELMKSWHRPVYFDQKGLLVKRLGIAAVPAIVSQEGMLLRVNELVVQP